MSKSDHTKTILRARAIKNWAGVRSAAVFLRISGFTLEQALKALGFPVRNPEQVGA